MKKFHKRLINFKKLLKLKGGHKIGSNLKELLKELRLEEYKNKFVQNKVLYEAQLVPKEVPRSRLTSYISKNFIDKNYRGWEIDASLVKIDKFSSINKVGTYGKIQTGDFKVGISSIRIAIKEIIIDDVTVTKSSVIKEVTIMSQLRHRNVVACYGCWLNDGERIANIALELCEKGDLYTFRRTHKDLNSELKLDFLLQIAKGMKYIHSKNLLHRDLKPQNVLVASDEKTLKICDFGTSKGVDSVKGTLCGTPAYLAPEQFAGIVVDNPKVLDIFAFGIVCFEVWSGLIPYHELQQTYKNNTFKFLIAVHGNQDIEIERRKITRPPTSIKELDDCPEDLKDLMRMCWHPDYDERPPTFDFIVDEIMKYQHDFLSNKKKKKTGKNQI